MLKFRVMNFSLKGIYILFSCSAAKLFEVSLLGVKSLFGQASSLLLKQCPSVYNLKLFDETDISTAKDLKIIDTPCKVEAYQGISSLNEAVRGCDIVLIGDDYLSTPHTCFDVMAPKMQDYAKAIAEFSPNAVIVVAASPVNKLVPVLSELLRENGIDDCNKVIGSTAVNSMRANCILASYVQSDPRKLLLPVVGGDTEETIVPLFSQAKPFFDLSEAVRKRLVEEIQHAHSLIYSIKKKSEALNKAYSTIGFLNSVMAGLKGEANIINIAFSRTTQVEGIEYFALPVLLGRFGIQARYGIPKILPFESDLINECVFNLKKDIEYAKLFCKSQDTAVEFCKRNIANKFQKSKEFENLVKGMKKNKKDDGSGEKLINKLKPPTTVESFLMSTTAEKPFNPSEFCFKNQTSKQNETVPITINSETMISSGLLYNIKNENEGKVSQILKSSSAITPICQPISCPDPPKEKTLNYSSIVSLVEDLIKKNNEKIVKEKETDKCLTEEIAKKLILDMKEGKKEKISEYVPKNDIENFEKDIFEANEQNKNTYFKNSSKENQSMFLKMFEPTLNTFKIRDEYECDKKKEQSRIKYNEIEKNKFSNEPSRQIKNTIYETNTIKPFYKFGNVWDSDKTYKNLFTGEQSRKKTENVEGVKSKIKDDDRTKLSQKMNRIINLIDEDQNKKDFETYKTGNPGQACLSSMYNSSLPQYNKVIGSGDMEKCDSKNMKTPQLDEDEISANPENKMNDKSFYGLSKYDKKNYFSQKYKNQNISNKILNNQSNELNGKFVFEERKNENVDYASGFEKHAYIRKKLSEAISIQNKQPKSFEVYEKPSSNINKGNNHARSEYKTSIDAMLGLRNKTKKIENVIDRNNTNDVRTRERKIKYSERSNEYETLESHQFKINEQHSNYSKNRNAFSLTKNQEPISSKKILNNIDVSNIKMPFVSNLDKRLPNEMHETVSSPVENCGTQTEINGQHINLLLQTIDSDIFGGKFNPIKIDSTRKENEKEIAKSDEYNEEQLSTRSFELKCNEILADPFKDLNIESSLEKNKVEVADIESNVEGNGAEKFVKENIKTVDFEEDEKSVSCLSEEQYKSQENPLEIRECTNLSHSENAPINLVKNVTPNNDTNEVFNEQIEKSKDKTQWSIADGHSKCIPDLKDRNFYSENGNIVKPKSSFTITESFINKRRNKLSSETVEQRSSEKSSISCNSNKKYNSRCNTGKKSEEKATNKSNDLKNSDQQPKTSDDKFKIFETSHPKSLIQQKINAMKNIKNENYSEMLNTLSGQIGKTVREINKKEQSLRIKDKNGFNNYFLIKNSLPKIKGNVCSNEKKFPDRNKLRTLLKENVSKDVPVLSINKNSPRIIKSNKIDLRPKSKNKQILARKNENKSFDSLLTKNNLVVPSLKCPVHRNNYFLNIFDKYKPPIIKDIDILASQNSNVLNNLCLSSEINGGKRSASQRFCQKAPCCKTYSTSSHSGLRSPSRLWLDKRKSSQFSLPSKDSHFVATVLKKPSGYSQKQRITKILEQSLKKKNSTPTNEGSNKSTKPENESMTLKDMNKVESKFLNRTFPPGVSGETVKIVEKFFNRSLDSSYTELSLKNSPMYSQSINQLIPNQFKKNESPIRKKTQRFNNIREKTDNEIFSKRDPNSSENDILGRGTCSEHVKNKYLSHTNKSFVGNRDAWNTQQKIPIGSTVTSNLYSDFVKDYERNEYSPGPKFPSIRYLHKHAFSSS